MLTLAFLVANMAALPAFAAASKFRVATLDDDPVVPLLSLRKNSTVHELGELLNLGLVSHNTIWLEFDLKGVDRDLVLKLTDLQTESVTLYKEVDVASLEELDSFADPLIGAVGVPLPRDPAVTSMVIKIVPKQYLSIKPQFGTANLFSIALSRMLAIKMMFVAVVLVLALITLCGYFLFRLSFLVFFGLYGIGMALLLLNYSGLGSLYLDHVSLHVRDAVFVLSHTVTAGCFYAFLVAFMNLKTHAPRVTRIFYAGMAFSAVASLIGLVYPSVGQMLVPVSGVVSLVLISLAVSSMLKAGSLPTYIYLASSVVYLGFVTLYILNLIGVATDHWLFGYELSVGTSADMAMLLVAVAAKVKAVEAERQTERERARIALEQNGRLVSLGLLAGGIAHEVNNPLAIIKVTASNLRYVIESEHGDKKMIMDLSEKVENTVDRISTIIKSLRVLAGGRTPTSEMSIISLREAIEPVLNLTRDRFELNSVTLHVEGWSHDVHMLGDLVQFSQAVMNLIANAYEVARAEAPGWIGLRAISTDKRIRIEVSNSGPKIAKDIAMSIFDPFFTTKPIGSGMGLGLSICKTLIDNLGGTLELDLEAPHTTFVILLNRATPLADVQGHVA